MGPAMRYLSKSGRSAGGEGGAQGEYHSQHIRATSIWIFLQRSRLRIRMLLVRFQLGLSHRFHIARLQYAHVTFCLGTQRNSRAILRYTTTQGASSQPTWGYAVCYVRWRSSQCAFSKACAYTSTAGRCARIRLRFGDSGPHSVYAERNLNGTGYTMIPKRSHV